MESKVIAQLAISPRGVGVSVGKYVKAAVNVIKKFDGIRVQFTPMSTIIEADTVETILEVTKLAHNELFKLGVDRVVTELKIDDRRDKERVMEDKVKKIE